MFVEVGCIDGLRFSNTLALELRGWRGVCVEAHADYIDGLKRNRPGSIVIHCAVGERDGGEVVFHANSRGSLSTLDPSREADFRARYGEFFTGFVPQRVRLRGISSLLDELDIANVDVLSLDIEGCEVPALRSIDFSRHRPRVLLVECESPEQEREIDSILLPAGYIKGFRLEANLFYSTERALLTAVAGERHAVMLTHTQHPLDHDGDRSLSVEIDLSDMEVAAGMSAPSDIHGNPSELIASPDAVARYSALRDFPFLVSFPRTGSHWLRMLLELYFDRPLLTRSFFAHANRDYLLYHSHDMDMNLVRRDILYLYRDPVETVYSQLRYHGEEMNDARRLAYWGDLYGQHADKWLCRERHSTHKTVLSYEGLLTQPETEFAAAIRHLGGHVDPERLRNCLSALGRDRVKERTSHDQRVVNLDKDYAKQRERFREQHGETIWRTFLQGRDGLAARFGRPAVAAAEGYVPARHPPQAWEYRKIIGLVPGKNEARHIEFCIRALAQVCDSIVYFDDNSSDDTVAIVESIAQECRVERIIRKSDAEFHETIRRAVPLEAGRMLGGTHFVVIDADEAFTGSLVEGDLLRRHILTLQPGETLELAWIQLWRSVDRYRSDASVWTNNYKAFVFADDGTCRYDETFIHLERVPSGLNGKRHRIEGYEHGLMHFQFVNWRNLLVKQAWYRCLERIHDPDKPAQAINELYAPSKDERDLGLRQVPDSWFAAYPFFEAGRLQQPDTWREQQVLDWFDEYGEAHFSDLDIWDVDWGRGLGKPVVKAPAPSAEDLVAQGERLFAAGDLAGARACFEHAVAAGGNSATAYNNLGVLSWQVGDAGQALRHLAAALEADPTLREAVLNGVQLLITVGRKADALALGDDWLATHPEDAELRSIVESLRAGVAPVDNADGTYRVSAIVSTYNSEGFIRGCLEDLEAQTIADRMEIIVIDSGSTQNERAIVEEFQRRYDNIVYLRTEREPLYAAWNRGVSLARGSYLTNANTDDRHRRDAFELMARALDEHPEAGLVYADCLITREPNESFENTSAERRLCWPDFSVRQALQYCFFGPQPMWRRAVHAEIGLFDTRYKVAGDYDFFLRLGIRYGAYHLPEPLGLYYEGNGLELGDPGRAQSETASVLHEARRNTALEKIYPELLAAPDDTIARAAALADFAQTISSGLYPDAELAEQCARAARELCMQPPVPHPVVSALPALMPAERNRQPWRRNTPASHRKEGFSFCVIAGGRRPDKLQRLIDSIHALGIPDYEIIVTGIAMPGDDVRYLERSEAARSGRTSALRNAAAAASSYDRIVFCDDDIVLGANWVSGIDKALQDHDIAVGRLLNSDGSRHWDWATVNGPRGHIMLDYGEPDSHLYLTSGLLALRASVWRANPWDEQRGYRQDEDVEFSQRLTGAGMSVACCPESVAIHDDDRYTQVGRVVLCRSPAGVQRWREHGWAECTPAQMLQAAEECLHSGEIADAADWLRYLLNVEPGDAAARVLWDDLEVRHGGRVEGLEWRHQGVEGLVGNDLRQDIQARSARSR